ISYAGITLDDFSKKYSTVEIVAVLNKGLWEKDFDKIEELVEYAQTINLDYSKITSIFFLPLQMIENPRVQYQDLEGAHILGQQIELITNYPLTAIDDYLIRSKAEILYGEDIIQSFPIPPPNLFWDAVVSDFQEIEEWTKEYPFHSSSSPDYKKAVNRILYFPRMLYSLKNNDILGKTKAAYWFSNEYMGEVRDFVMEVGLSRKKDISLINILNLEEKCKELLLFFIEKVLGMKNAREPELRNLVRKVDSGYDYSRLFMELRNIFGYW
ncbi:MAG: aminoglycoside adenylyltransferase domain-containing protein, partial [Candidatus Heimdallarchaeaceae archaeon]